MPTVGVRTRQAAEALGLGIARVHQLIYDGTLDAALVKGVYQVDEASLEQLVAARAAWVTVDEAAVLVGCTTTRIRRAVADGMVEQRAVLRAPTIRRADLEGLRPLVAAERRGEEQRRLDREQEASRPRRGDPPDDEHEWWTQAAVADVLGLSTSRIHQLVARESLPSTEHAGRRWFRSDHVLQVLSARAFRAAALRPPLD